MQLAIARAKAGLTQAELAKQAGIPQSVISDIENGKTTNPRVGTLRKLADLFGCTIDDLLRETQEGANEKVLEVLEDEEE